MPGVIEPETIHVDDLPTIWSPVQDELTPEEHVKELEDQATASLLWASPVAEQILRILLNETAVERVLDPPEGFDPEIQGEWRSDQVTFAFKRPIKLVKEERSQDRLLLEYKVEGAGYWGLAISPEEVTIGRL
jgi:hypothetical protein